ncbi:MAG TPA: hypothetical protein VF871_00375 [Burkholderiales bacterium]
MTAARRVPYLLMAAALLAASAPAQTRSIPEAALSGYIQHIQGMAVTMDGNPMQLAPGSTVRDQKNLIIVPAAMPRQGAWADYVVDRNGQIFRVWLLTPEEQAQPRNQPGR